MAVADAELAAMTHSMPRKQGELAALTGREHERRAELAAIQAQLARIDIHAGACRRRRGLRRSG